MRTIPIADLTPADEVGAIGIHYTPDQVIIFEPGDESTPEWQALHPPPDPIAEAKAAKRQQITSERDAICVAPVQALGRTWQADEQSQALLTKAVTMAAATQAAYTSAFARKDALKDAATLAEIEAI